jgi:hypothetical protein
MQKILDFKIKCDRGKQIFNWETPMKKAFYLFLTLILVLVVVGNSGAENKRAQLIPVKPPTIEAPSSVQNVDSGMNSDTQYADPAPRDQLYVFWILGKVISYPIDKIESYISRRINSVQQPKAVPAAAPGRVYNPFDSLNWREIPPAPPVEQRNTHNR